MKSSERKQPAHVKNVKNEFYVLTVDEMFKIRGGDGSENDNGKLK